MKSSTRENQLSADPLKFPMPEYESAMSDFVWQVIHGVVDLDPVIGPMIGKPTKRAGPTRNIPDSGQDDQTFESIQHELLIPHRLIPETDVGAYIDLLYQIGESHSNSLGEFFFRNITTLTEATGNVISANGRPLSWELLLELIESVEFTFDEDEKISGNPMILMNPADAERLRSIPQPPDLQLQLEAILKTKLERHRASKRNRQLSR